MYPVQNVSQVIRLAFNGLIILIFNTGHAGIVIMFSQLKFFEYTRATGGAQKPPDYLLLWNPAALTGKVTGQPPPIRLAV